MRSNDIDIDRETSSVGLPLAKDTHHLLGVECAHDVQEVQRSAVYSPLNLHVPRRKVSRKKRM